MVVILDCLNIEISSDSSVLDTDDEVTFSGNIINIAVKGDSYYQIEIEPFSGGKVLLNYYDNIDEYEEYFFSECVVSASMKEPDGSRNPNCFNYKKYLKSRGISYVGTINFLEKKDDENSVIIDVYRKILKCKNSFLQSIENNNAKGLISGILFGEKELLAEEVYEKFSANGTAHILAVSGLHVGIVYKTLEKLMGRRQSAGKFIVIVVCMLFMGVIANWSISVTRAVGMVIIKVLSVYLDRRYDLLTAASFMALVLMTTNPYVIYNISFQMSFLAIVAIAFLLPHIPSKFPDFLAMTIVVNIGMTLYQMYQFNSFFIISFVANIPIIYLAGILMPLSMVTFLLHISEVPTFVFDKILESISVFTIKVNDMASFGFDKMDIISPPLWLVLIIYGTMLFMLSESFYIMKKRKKTKQITAIFLSVCCTSLIIAMLLHSPISRDEIVFVDVGQGDAIHFRIKDKNILIDGGGNINYSVGKNILKPYLLKNRVRKVDLALATHLHTDHYLGLRELQEEKMISVLSSGLTAGEEFNISKEARIETLWPLKETVGKDGKDPLQDENKNCSVFMVYYEDIKILITGDLDCEGERGLIKHYGKGEKLQADILKIGHHGSQYSTSDEFLETVNPTYCVIQVGKNNYGHPHRKIIEKCTEKGIILLRNDKHGAVGFAVDGNEIEFHTMIKDR